MSKQTKSRGKVNNYYTPPGYISVKEYMDLNIETKKQTARNNWHNYIKQCRKWCRGKNRMLDAVIIRTNTRGRPRKYYKAKTLLEFWEETEQPQLSSPSTQSRKRRKIWRLLKRKAEQAEGSATIPSF